jgi:isopenicillin-N N-acyltransferase-like protein
MYVPSESASETRVILTKWQWENEQSPNIISMHITPSPSTKLPTIHMMTEAGIIGKIGLNSSSVGVTLNAIKARGVDFAKLPCHLALRTVLNSISRAEAVDKLTRAGVASACHITVADAATGGRGLECSAQDIVQMPMSDHGVCTHSNHFVNAHAEGVLGAKMLLDSPLRLERIRTLIAQEVPGTKPSFEAIERLLKDEEGHPGSICRASTEKSSLETLFSVCMDLGERVGRVKMGRPIEEGRERVELRP